MTLVDQVLEGDRRAAARLISLLENDGREAQRALSELYAHTGRAHIVGVTGASGTGKSTLVAELAKEYRRRGQTVGIVSVDPTSPFSGGALLGDRIRMQELTKDTAVFMRSMATRGNLGGLARATGDAVKVLDAFGKQVIFVETVGAGQGEVEIAKNAHTVVVVEAPGLGDDIQAIKAGLLEIADLFVVNKADREGADRSVSALEAMLDLDSRQNRWRPPVLKTVALHGQGIAAVADALQSHLDYLRASGQYQTRERGRAEAELRALLARELLSDLMRRVPSAKFAAMVDAMAARQIDAHTAVRRLIAGG